MRVLVANEPRSYREVMAGALRRLRPLVEVVVAEPTDLDHEVLLHAPDLVVCSSLTEAVESGVSCWVVLYPGGDSRVEINLSGECSTSPGIDFEGLLSVFDRAESLRKKTA